MEPWLKSQGLGRHAEKQMLEFVLAAATFVTGVQGLAIYVRVTVAAVCVSLRDSDRLLPTESGTIYVRLRGLRWVSGSYWLPMPPICAGLPGSGSGGCCLSLDSLAAREQRGGVARISFDPGPRDTFHGRGTGGFRGETTGAA